MAIFTAAIAVFLQTESNATAPATQGLSALTEMIGNVGPIAVGVLLLLLFASLYSWTVIFGKMMTFRRATQASRKFIGAFRKATRLNEIAAVTSECQASPLAQVFDDVYETYKRVTGGSGPREILRRWSGPPRPQPMRP